jgi:hypothetical protein
MASSAVDLRSGVYACVWERSLSDRLNYVCVDNDSRAGD